MVGFFLSLGCCVVGEAAPVLAVEHPAGVPLVSGTATVDCGATWLGQLLSEPVRLRNAGDSELRDITFTLSGPHAGDFAVVPMAETVLPPQASGTFLVQFQPGGICPRPRSTR